MTRTATVIYKPTQADVTDKITASYNSKELVSKEFYIAPDLSCFWGISEILYVGEEESCFWSPLIMGVDSITTTNFSIIDSSGKEFIKESSYELRNDKRVDFKVTPESSQKDKGVSFTVSFKVNNIDFKFVSDTIPVQDRSSESYNLVVQEGKLVYNTEGHVVLSSNSTPIAVGETINFTSTYGLNADGKLTESD